MYFAHVLDSSQSLGVYVSLLVHSVILMQKCPKQHHQICIPIIGSDHCVAILISFSLFKIFVSSNRESEEALMKVRLVFVKSNMVHSYIMELWNPDWKLRLLFLMTFNHTIPFSYTTQLKFSYSDLKWQYRFPDSLILLVASLHFYQDCSLVSIDIECCVILFYANVGQNTNSAYCSELQMQNKN